MFRIILKEHVDEETEVLWHREMPLPEYMTTFFDSETVAGKRQV